MLCHREPRRHFRAGLMLATAAGALLFLTLPGASARAADDAVSTPVDSTDSTLPSLDEVIVTAPRTTSPLEVTTDPKSPVQPVPPNDGAGYLKNIPGFSMIRKGGTGGDPVFRGEAGSRLDIVIDGTPILGGCPMRMDPPTAYAFPESFDTITVLKGPQSVVYGGASAATVLMERDTQPFKTFGWRGEAGLLGGSFGRNDEMLDIAGGASQGFARFIGTRSASGDYTDGRGDKVHSAYGRKSGTAILGWTPNADTLFQVTLDKSAAHAAYADRLMDGVIFDRDGVNLKASRKNLSPLVGKATAQVWYDAIDHVMDRFSLRPFTGGMMPALSNPSRQMLGGRAEVDLTPGESNLVTLGIDYAHDQHATRALTAAQYLAGVNYESLPSTRDMTFDTVGLFGQGTHVMNQATRVIGGYRFDYVRAVQNSASSLPTGAPVQRTPLNDVFARIEHDLAWTLPVTVYAGLGHTQRAPDYWERTKVFTLRPEIATQLDVGALFNTERWQGSASLFYTRYEDYILISAATAKGVQARTLGGEGELTWSFARFWNARATLSVVQGDNLSDHVPLAQMPPLQTTWGVNYDNGTYLGGLLLRAVDRQDRVDVGWGNIVGTDIGPAGGFAVLSANAGWRPRSDTLLSVGVDNILNQTYAEYLSRSGTNTLLAAGYVPTTRVNEPGRTFWVKGTIRF